MLSVDTGTVFSTIHSAVDAEVIGDGEERLLAYSGTTPFDELVTVTKSGLRIEGGDAPDRAELLGTFVVTAAANVTIDGFAISAFDRYNNTDAAFQVDDVTGVVITDNVVTGDGAAGDDKGVINAAAGAAEGATIAGNTFTALLQGVYANPTAAFTIDGNAFQANGVASANDASSTITGNTFGGSTVEDVGLSVGGSTISGNTFDDTTGNYVCDYMPDAYVLVDVAAANTFPHGYAIEEDSSAPDCITAA